MVGQIQVVIADDHALFREGLGLILIREKDIQVVGEAADGPQTIDVTCSLKPDILLLDTTISGMSGIEVIPPIRRMSPETKPLMLTSSQDEEKVFEVLKAGARGYLSKDAKSNELAKAIRVVQRGEVWIERKLMARLLDSKINADLQESVASRETEQELTSRELEVIRCLPKGWTNKEIANTLCISEKTVKSHLHSIFRKLNVTRRLQATLYAIERGWK